MNFYDVLAAEKWGGGIPTTNFFDLLFAQYISGEQRQTYEGTLPATIIANGDDMRQYQIYGNTGGVGDRTINYFDYTKLFDGYTYDSNGQMILNPDVASRAYYAAIPPIQVTPGATYLRTHNLTPLGNTVNYYDSEKNFIAKATPGVGIPFTVPNNCHFITYIVDVKSYDRKKYMLTEGTTPPASFVPFGYELSLSVSDGTNTTTTPIYIGDDPLGEDEYADYQAQKVVREIKKYIFDGTEDWQRVRGAGSDETKSYFRLQIAPLDYLDSAQGASTCSHFSRASVTTSSTNVGYGVYNSSTVGFCTLNVRPENVSTMSLSDFTTWLVEQYTGGTPVTFLCALQTPEEADPPVALPALPTCEGTTIVDYAGSGTAPEKVYFEYQGGKQP